MYANIAIQLVTFVSVGLKVVKSGGKYLGRGIHDRVFQRKGNHPHQPIIGFV